MVYMPEFTGRNASYLQFHVTKITSWMLFSLYLLTDSLRRWRQDTDEGIIMSVNICHCLCTEFCDSSEAGNRLYEAPLESRSGLAEASMWLYK